MWQTGTRVSVSAATWMLSVTLMAVGTVQRNVYLCHWSLLLSIAAATLTAWQIIHHERARVETIARAAAEAAIRQVQLHSVR